MNHLKLVGGTEEVSHEYSLVWEYIEQHDGRTREGEWVSWESVCQERIEADSLAEAKQLVINSKEAIDNGKVFNVRIEKKTVTIMERAQPVVDVKSLCRDKWSTYG